MNKTQKLYGELMDELTQYLSHEDAKYFAKWLLANYGLKKYEDIESIDNTLRFSSFIDEHDYPIT